MEPAQAVSGQGGVKPLLLVCVMLSVGDAGGKGDVPGSLNRVSVQEEEPQVVLITADSSFLRDRADLPRRE